ncbi:MAG: oxidoreductase [Chitinophagaceae bacterium]|nr:oxidoreductase [Chitinophagaceae bacterium]
MKKQSFILAIALVFCAIATQAQQIEILTTGTQTSIRGMSVVDDEIVWVSGSGGKIGKSTDGGKTWDWMTVPGFEKREFRDIEAFDANTAVVLAIAEPGQILKTTNGGRNWKVVFTDTAKGMFLDAMDFADPENGIAIGDPLPGSSFIYRVYTRNAGNNWFRNPEDEKHMSPVSEGEAMFASSGTNLVFLKSDGFIRNNRLLIATGGKSSNVLIQPAVQKISLPIVQGLESTGANSIAALSLQNFIVVGGNFANDKDTTLNCSLTKDGGKTFIRPSVPPHGYRSCVEYLSKEKLVTCGTSGVDVSEDGGNTWRLISEDGFHVCQKSKKGKAVFLAGGKGKIAKLSW